MKSKNKGFTLIELLAVLVVTGIVLVIAIQSYDRINENSNIQKYDYQWKLTKNASDIYSDGIVENLNFDDCFIIDYNMLTSTDLLKEDDVSCQGYVLLIKNGNKTIYDDSLLKCSKGSNVIKKLYYDGKEQNVDIANIPKDLEIVYNTENNKSIKLNQCVSLFDSNVKGISSTTNSIDVSASCSDFDSGISTYQFELSDSTGNVIKTSSESKTASYTFNELADDTKYVVKTICRNDKDKIATSDPEIVSTKELKKPIILSSSDNDKINDTDWYKKYTYVIKYDDTGIGGVPGHYFEIKADGNIKNIDNLIISSDIDVNIYDGSNWVVSDKNNIKLNTKYMVSSKADEVKLTYVYSGAKRYNIGNTINPSISDSTNTKNINENIKINCDDDDCILIDNYIPQINIKTNKDYEKYKIEVQCTPGPSGIKEIKLEKKDSVNKLIDTQTSTNTTLSKVYDYVVSANRMENYYKHDIYCTNNAGVSEMKYSNINVTASIEFNPLGVYTDWETSKSYSIEYYEENMEIETLNYFYSPFDGTTNFGVYKCGTDRGNPDASCSTIQTTTIEAGNWYRVNNANIVVNVIDDVDSTGDSIIARIGYGQNVTVPATMLVTKIDNSAPVIGNVSYVVSDYDSAVLNIQATDVGSGIAGYLITVKDKNGNIHQGGGHIYDNLGADATPALDGLISGETYTYYIKAVDKVGNVSAVYENDISITTCPSLGHSEIFNFMGGVQEFIAPCAGTYKLEVWGAQGGEGDALDNSPGYGGYSTGEVYLTAGQKLYVVVGGQGKQGTGPEGAGCTIRNYGWDASDLNSDFGYLVQDGGGYNGGGNAGRGVENCMGYRSGGGGGATHIATTNRGVLANYSGNKDEVLIVAGGGAGEHGFGVSGVGGGDSTPIDGTYHCYYNSPVELPGGYMFGQGETPEAKVAFCEENGEYDNEGYPYFICWYESAPGGGGGWDGGRTTDRRCAAGGTGHINENLVFNGQQRNGVREGNGYAKITVVSY